LSHIVALVVLFTRIENAPRRGIVVLGLAIIVRGEVLRILEIVIPTRIRPTIF